MKNLKKVFAGLLALLLLFSLAACDNTKKEPEDPGVSDGGNPDNTGDGEDIENPDDESDDTDDGGIGGEEADEGEGADDSEEAGTLAVFFDELKNTYTFAATAPLDDSSIANYYPGIEEYTLVQSIFEATMMSAAVCEIVLVECENAEDAAAIAEILETRKQAQIDGGAWYPASMDKWKDAQVVSSGSYAALFACDSAAEMAEAFTANFS